MSQRNRLRISGKDLGAVAHPEFCIRCFWLQRSAAQGLPYQIFPGIFSSIDAYTKRVVHGWFDKHAKPPIWLATFADVVRYIEPPHYSKFCHLDRASGILLTGAPDGLFVRSDGSLLIVDYKTAKHTEGQDVLLPIYETQLNAYAFIAERLGMGKVSDLALIYTEPVTTDKAATSAGIHVINGFRLGFSVGIIEVALRPDSIPPLLARTRNILDLVHPPAGRPGCPDCERLDGLLELAGKSCNSKSI
jgi:hypothetical protein